MTGPDPNEGSIDPMIPEYWQLGEAVQDRIISEGYQHEEVDGIAIDIHDLLQSADRIRDEFAKLAVDATSREALLEALQKLDFEFRHIAWHCEAAQTYLGQATANLKA